MGLTGVLPVPAALGGSLSALETREVPRFSSRERSYIARTGDRAYRTPPPSQLPVGRVSPRGVWLQFQNTLLGLRPEENATAFIGAQEITCAEILFLEHDPAEPHTLVR